MLQSLMIRNYAIINELEIDFNPGLNIITGETGAGKSILLGALGLILGQRADTSVLKNNHNKCIIEGTFDISKYNLQAFFGKNELEYENITILRREININGKSRAFINDMPVNLTQMSDLGVKLIDIHSQHHNLNLNDLLFQTKIVDTLAGNDEIMATYQNTFSRYKQELQELNNAIETNKKAKEEEDFLQFQFDELEKAKFQENEQEELEEELNVLTNAEEIKSLLSNAGYALDGEEGSVMGKLKNIIQLFSRLKSIYAAVNDLPERIESAYIELKDIAEETEMLGEKIDINPGRLEQVNERLDLLYSLQKKHHVDSVAELISIKDELDKKLSSIFLSEENIGRLKEKINTTKKELEQLSSSISKNRIAVIPRIEERVVNILQVLGMPGAKFKINRTVHDELTWLGKDKIEFLFSANKNMALQDISRTASGGEISRLMLSIKSLVTSSMNLPTIILDEIDTGVSGEIADKVGSIIKNMSGDMQVINITHLPQVASKGDYHYLVHKVNDDHTTETKIKLLTKEERLMEIAKMLSGEELTEAAIENARTLLKVQ